MQQRVAGRKVVVFIDDAQALAPEVLEQVRLISNLETTRDKLIQTGSDRGAGTDGTARFARVCGRWASACRCVTTIGGLTEAETAAYIQHRLTRASRRTAAAVRTGGGASSLSTFRRQSAADQHRRQRGALGRFQSGAEGDRCRHRPRGLAERGTAEMNRAKADELRAGAESACGRRPLACGVLVAVTAAFVALRPAGERPGPPGGDGVSAPPAASCSRAGRGRRRPPLQPLVPCPHRPSRHPQRRRYTKPRHRPGRGTPA